MHLKTYHATHPDSRVGASNDDLRDRYLITDLFASGEVRLNHTYYERMVIGGENIDYTDMDVLDVSQLN